MTSPRKIFLAIPTHSGTLKQLTEATVALVKLEALALGHSVLDVRWVGDCYIPRARSVLLAKFLASDCTDIFWLDSDVACEPGTFARVMSHPVEFVAGVYRTKSDTEHYPVRYLPNPELWADPTTGLLELSGVPFGFVRFTREVAERLVAAHPESAFRIHEEPDLACWCIFDTELIGGEYFGEDFLFCQRYRAIGGKVWVDPEIELMHVGRNDEATVYRGHFGNWLRNRNRFDRQMLANGLHPQRTLDALRQALPGPQYAALFDAAAGSAA